MVRVLAGMDIVGGNRAAADLPRDPRQNERVGLPRISKLGIVGSPQSRFVPLFEAGMSASDASGYEVGG